MSNFILNTASIQEADRISIQELGIPELTLMEAAGKAVAKEIMKTFGNLRNKSIVIFCGKGNNGGDGLVAANELYKMGALVKVYLLTDKGLKPSTEHNLKQLQKLSKSNKSKQIQIEILNDLAQLETLGTVDLFIDALLGTGLKKDLQGKISDLVLWLNEEKVPKVAIDLSTGLNADNGSIMGNCVKADLTVTLAARKIGCLIAHGPYFCGRLEVVDIGIPSSVLQKCSLEGLNLQATTDKEVYDCLPVRDWNTHKYLAGSVLSIVGSREYTGAAYLSSMAALRSGAGIVTCMSSSSAQKILAVKFNEVISFPLAETSEGSIALVSLNPLLEKAGKANAVLLGCGLGQNPETQELVRQFSASFKGKLVLDADGLNSLVGRNEIIKSHSQGNWLLTPHWGEFKRLTSITEELNFYDKLACLKKFAKEWNCTILLKGFPSLVALPSGETFLNETGNPAAATAGSGDVLAGICTSLISQGLSPQKAAVSGIYLAGLCADFYVKLKGSRGMIASDLLSMLPCVLSQTEYSLH